LLIFDWFIFKLLTQVVHLPMEWMNDFNNQILLTTDFLAKVKGFRRFFLIS
jgi:hypothetical protein